MRMLQRGPGGFRLSNLLPYLPLVRGEADSQAGDIATDKGRDHSATPTSVAGLDELRPRGIGITPTGKGKGVLRAEWPGRVYGVRAPEIGETPLSDSEWPYLFRGDLA